MKKNKKKKRVMINSYGQCDVVIILYILRKEEGKR